MWIYLALISTVVFWGGTFAAGRLIAQDITPFAAAFLRFLIASICLIVLILNRQKRWPGISKNDILPLVLLGLTGIAIYNGFFFMGLRRIEAGRAALIVATVPVVVTILSTLIYREKLTVNKTIGIILSFVGAIIVITRGDWQGLINGSIGLGELFISVCVVCWAIYTIVGKDLLKRISPIVAVMYASLFGMLFLFPFALHEGLIAQIKNTSLLNWLGLGYLGFFGTVLGFVWYYKGVKEIGPVRAAIFINFVPVSAILISWLFLNESITPSLIFGGFFILTGVFLTNYQLKAEVS